MSAIASVIVAITITTTIEQTRQAVAQARQRGRTIGLVPTMGALHAGHASLIRTARQETGFVIVSIFVNPAQFGPQEDLTRYPRPFENDVKLCELEHADLLFHPAPEAIYPRGFRTAVDVSGWQDVLEGATRPGHFRGVATVVLKLFNIVAPDIAYFGQKDAQQARIIEQMVHDLDLPVQMRICPTVREPDGLAMSSRNVYLNSEERRQAVVLFRVLQAMRAEVEAGQRHARTLIDLATDLVAGTAGTRLDYVAIVAYDTLEPLDRLQGKVLIPLAVYVGTTRLIDNLVLTIEP